MNGLRKAFTDRRLAQRLTQVALAERAGTTRKTVADFESGAAGPRLPTLLRLFAALGLELTVREADSRPTFEELKDRYPDDLGAPARRKRARSPR